MSAITGRDAGDLKKYRTEIPNIVFTLGLDPYALSLYCHLKRTTGAADGGVCWKSTRTLADETGMSVGKVSDARNELEKPRDELGGKALISVERPKDRSKSTNVVCEDIWPENFGVFTTRTRECSPHERKKELSSFKNSRRDADASSEAKMNWFSFFCELANSLEVIITPEDRKGTAKHFKDLLRIQEPTDAEMRKVVSKMLEARTSGFDLSPQKALGKVRGSNVHQLKPRAEEAARPKKRVL